LARHDAIMKDDNDSSNGAKAAGLRYISSLNCGIRRRRHGSGFIYLSRTGKSVRDEATLSRIKSLVIPPAWEQVCICSDPLGHIQAVGCDQRGRKQYKYHSRWRETRDENKYEHMIDFARALPKIRSKVRRDLKAPGLPRSKVLATVVRLLQATLIRVGNEEYARENHSFGLTTMRNRHVHINGNAIHFEFRGKSGIEHVIDLHDRRLAKIVRACQHLPGQELFQYIDPHGGRHGVASDDVNQYLHEIAGNEFTAKDFRTWAGSVMAAMQLQKIGPYKSQTQAKKNTVAAIEAVAKELGNTRAVCRKCYIHPGILTAYVEGTLLKSLESQQSLTRRGLRAEEIAVLTLLQAGLKTTRKKKRTSDQRRSLNSGKRAA
jgi:DNA topoisomerase I